MDWHNRNEQLSSLSYPFAAHHPPSSIHSSIDENIKRKFSFFFFDCFIAIWTNNLVSISLRKITLFILYWPLYAVLNLGIFDMYFLRSIHFHSIDLFVNAHDGYRRSLSIFLLLSFFFLFSFVKEICWFGLHISQSEIEYYYCYW